MPKKAVVVQHVPHEGLGSLGPFLKQAGIEAEYIRTYRGEKVPRCIGTGAEKDTVLIVLGGPMGAYEDDKYPFLKDELRLIESALKNGSPALGICLGSQLMARAAGAEVYPGKAKEIGWYTLRLTEEGKRDRLFVGLPDEMDVFQWHGDTFDVPFRGVLLASSDLFPNQLLKLGKRAYAIQFHLEVTGAMVDSWLRENKEEIEALKGKISPKAVEEETSSKIATLRRRGEAVFSRFLRL
ncbi:MAG: gamma-glutamyl-gamma-aminobutyrate hydrolase family protein [Deltaproteobacteria bacterium]|nr:gamma-glutamyl-gamma-aminobutyrate hydrolase family protein [Deltaproteobacteria bacterium]